MNGAQFYVAAAQCALVVEETMPLIKHLQVKDIDTDETIVDESAP